MLISNLNNSLSFKCVNDLFIILNQNYFFYILIQTQYSNLFMNYCNIWICLIIQTKDWQFEPVLDLEIAMLRITRGSPALII